MFDVGCWMFFAVHGKEGSRQFLGTLDCSLPDQEF